MADALAAIEAQHRQAPSLSARRRVLSAGNAGKLGEALIARLLALPDYREVVAATGKDIRSTSPRLGFVPIAALREPEAWRRIDEAVLLVGGKHTFFKRDDVFPILDEAAAIEIASAAVHAGITRLLVLVPMEAWHAATSTSVAQFDTLELALRKLAPETLIVVRPSSHSIHTEGRSWLDSIARGMISTLSQYLLPQRLAPLRAQVVAEAAANWLATLPAGQHFLGAEDPHSWMTAQQTRSKLS